MAHPIIAVRGLSKHFGEFVAVDELTLTVAAGSIFAFSVPTGRARARRSAC
jgi:ABC-type branched-subunit amino acid transport system ATPase component